MSVMKPNEKKAWLELLESGKLKQGVGALREIGQTWNSKTCGYVDKPEYCCLGVAQLAITGREPKCSSLVLRANRFGLSAALQQALAAANDANTTYEVRGAFARAGFTTIPERRSIKDSDGDVRSSFKQIAAWIRKNL